MPPASTTACARTMRSLMCCPWSPALPRLPAPAGMAFCFGELYAWPCKGHDLVLVSPSNSCHFTSCSYVRVSLQQPGRCLLLCPSQCHTTQC